MRSRSSDYATAGHDRSGNPDIGPMQGHGYPQARTKVEMAGYDRKIARANYYPNISATGAYMYNEKSIALINDELSDKLTGTGAAIQGKVNEKVTSIVEAISKLPNGADPDIPCRTGPSKVLPPVLPFCWH